MAASKQRLVADLKQTGGQYARMFPKLQDSLDVLWRGEDYPRIPSKTVTFAEAALRMGLIEKDEFVSIVGPRREELVDDWDR